MAIDVGIFADMSHIVGGSWTYVNKGNPANATGIITSCAIWAAGICQNVEIASFIANGNNLATRDYAALPDLAVGTNSFMAIEGDFTPFEIRTGDYIGIFFTAVSPAFLGVDSGPGAGVGLWSKSGDHIPTAGADFTLTATSKISVYAEGFQFGQLNIGDTWKDKQNILINIGNDWKQIVPGSGINISDVWKNILH